MLKLIAASALALAASAPSDRPPQPVHLAQTVHTCFKTGEEVSGRSKVCYYNCLGDRVAITISAYEQCPHSIDRPGG